MKKLILDKSKWICGEPNESNACEVARQGTFLGEGNTQLLNAQGYMCCLGQFSLQLNPNLKLEDILLVEAPIGLEYIVPSLNYMVAYLEIDQTQLTIEAMPINDNNYTTVEEKIERLKELFAKHDYEIEVVN